jgi:membrane protein involved in colicin uptake
MKNSLLKKIFFVAIALYSGSSQTHASRINQRENIKDDTAKLMTITQGIYSKVSELDNENKAQVSEFDNLKIQRDQKIQELSAIEAEKARVAAEKAKAEEDRIAAEKAKAEEDRIAAEKAKAEAAEKARIAAEQAKKAAEDKAKAEEAEKARIAEEQAKKAAEDKAKADQAAAAQYQSQYRYRR